MPFDGSTYTKPHVFSAAALRDWLRTQDPATEYYFLDCGGKCLIDRYLLAHGIKPTSNPYMKLPAVVRHQIAPEHPWTFGAALARAEAVLADDA